VDGNDLFAMVKVIRDAAQKARDHKRPTFIEAVTYRLGDHTTADDARRYRDEKELESWKGRDPLIRMRAYLEGKKKWDDAKQEAMEAKAKELVSQVVKNAETIVDPTVDDVFNWTFAELPDEIVRQRETMRTSSLGQHPEQETLAAQSYQTT
jgi:TPP-dependent pyruvate/acetoin dehydrogenase alpha subunit